MPGLDAAELRAKYDAQLRGALPARMPLGLRVERDGPLLRYVGSDHGGWVDYRDLRGLEGAALDDLIQRQVRFFTDRGEPFEWKLHEHDLPADLADRLIADGFVPEDRETVVIATVASVAADPVLPEGVTLREVTGRADFDRIAAMEREIWQDDRDWLATSLASERAADPDAIVIVVAEAEGEVVCAAWVRFAQGTDFATLWGGGTLPSWRGRGIYRAIVAYRAGLAAERGFTYLQVDSSDDSRPILERLGFVPVTMTTPFVWTPPSTMDP